MKDAYGCIIVNIVTLSCLFGTCIMRTLSTPHFGFGHFYQGKCSSYMISSRKRWKHESPQRFRGFKVSGF